MIADKVKADTIETWKAEIIEKEHIKEVLDKIRAEVESLRNANPSYYHSGDMVDREEVFEIIDKYREDGHTLTVSREYPSQHVKGV